MNPIGEFAQSFYIGGVSRSTCCEYVHPLYDDGSDPFSLIFQAPFLSKYSTPSFETRFQHILPSRSFGNGLYDPVHGPEPVTVMPLAGLRVPIRKHRQQVL